MLMKSSLSVSRVIVMIILCMGIPQVASPGVTSRATADHSRQQTSRANDTEIFLPLVLAPRPTNWASDSIFGVQMYNSSGHNSPYYSSLIASGATWLRMGINWSWVEPENVSPAEYNWTRVDQALAAGASSSGGLNILATIGIAPEWAVLEPIRQDGPIKPEHLPDFAEFIGALVERYDGDGVDDAPNSPVVEYWEFYNEPDRKLTTGEGRWGEHPELYAQMLQTIYPVVKTANPRAQVVFGGIAYDFFEEQNGPFVRTFLADVLAAGGANAFDIFNFHAYPAFADNWVAPGGQGTGLVEKAEVLRQELNNAGIDPPMILSEAGWHSNNPPHFPGSEEIQARYVVEMFTQSLAANLQSMIWWMLYDPGGGGWDNGLVTSDSPPRRKLAFNAYQTMVNQMTGAEFVRTLSLTETGNVLIEAYEFSDDQRRPLYLAWVNPVASGTMLPLAITGEEVIVRDIYGGVKANVIDSADGTNDGRVQVMVGGQPAYLEVIR